MIREWTVQEAMTDKRVANFMKAFEQATSLVKVDSDYTFDRYSELMQKGICKILISEEDGTNELQGCIGFFVIDDIHEPVRIAVESFWFVHPNYAGVGKILFNAFEKLAIELGCKKLAMIHLVDSYPDNLKKFYEKNGYKLGELHYVKEI